MVVPDDQRPDDATAGSGAQERSAGGRPERGGGDGERLPRERARPPDRVAHHRGQVARGRPALRDDDPRHDAGALLEGHGDEILAKPRSRWTRIGTPDRAASSASRATRSTGTSLRFRHEHRGGTRLHGERRGIPPPCRAVDHDDRPGRAIDALRAERKAGDGDDVVGQFGDDGDPGVHDGAPERIAAAGGVGEVDREDRVVEHLVVLHGGRPVEERGQCPPFAHVAVLALAPVGRRAQVAGAHAHRRAARVHEGGRELHVDAVRRRADREPPDRVGARRAA